MSVNNYDARANLCAFMTGLTVVLLVGAFVLLRELSPVMALGLIVGNGLAAMAHRLLFPGRWTD